MVAIVTGNGLGVAGSSAGVLGVGGQLESAAAGGGASAYVNASTGNLVLQRQDEFLIGVGPDLGVVRTYNSQGSFDFDNNDSWQLSLYRHLSGLTGTVNTAGSTITRTGADGAQFVYTFDTTLGQYVNKDGAGSYDTLAYNSGADTWTWTDGDSRVTETYAAGTAGTWRIISTADTDGNTLSYSYDANNLITQVVDANGETTRLVYNGAKQLTQIDVLTAGNVTTTRVRYGYDGAGRLTSITTDLTPADGSITDGNAFVTTYTYDGASKRIASIVNSDGTHTSFTYDASGRIQTITDGLGRTTTLTYNAGNTVITDASGQSTTLTYDSVGQLTRLQGPVGSGQDIRYSYNANGDVTQLIDSRGNTVDYTYDANGNQTRQQDSAGQVVERTYSSANQLLTETVYAVADPDGAGAGAASAPQTTRYAYDGEQHLRFVVSPEGRVTEYRYNAAGQRTAAIQYSGTLYPVAGLGSTQSLSEADLTPFATTNQSASQRTDYTYDARGQLSTRTVYTQIDASGNGMLDGTEATTQYIYDQAGNLRQAIDARGVATPGIADDYVTTYAYDGLHRLVSRTDALGNTTTTVYNDANHQVVVTLANGLSTTSTYDAAGQLLAVAKSDISGALGTTGYLYDALGRVRQVTDPLGQKTTFLYDSANRQVGAIDGTGTLTETVYNANGQAIRTIRYAIPVNAAALAGDATQFTLAGVRPTTNSADRTAYTLYDQAGRVAKQIDALGAVTLYTYDGASRLVKTTQYANTLTTAQLTALKASTAEILPSDSNTVPVADTARDRVTRTLYDNDGLLVGTLDAAGYLTEYTYDAAGQPTAVIRYSTLSPSTYWASGTLAQLRPDANATNDQKTQTLYNARGEVVGVVDAEGYLTETQYDLAGNKLATTRYATKITYTPGNTLPQSRPAAHAEDQVVRAFFDANNRITRTESTPDGLVTTYAYDSVGNLTGTVKALGTTEERAQQYRYDSLGRVVAELGGEGTSALAALGANPTTGQIDDVWNRYGTRHVYDALGQRIATITPDGSTATGNRTRFYYDADDRLTHRINALGEVTEYRYDAFDGRTAERHYDTRIPSGILATLTGGSTASLGTAVSNLVADGYSESVVTYDLRGQAATLTDALGNVDTRSYNAFGELAQSTERIDASRTLTTSYAYDRRGLLTGTTQDVGGLNRITSALYDAFGRMTQATDARGGISKYSYDRLGRTVSVTNPLNVSETTTYDAFARTLTHTDGRGNVTTSSYDTTNRSLTVTTAEGISTTTVRNRHGETVSITDGRGNVTSYAYNRDGQLTSVTGPNGTTSTTYDSAGHVTTTTDARGIPTTYTYDAANRVLSRTVDPTGLNLKTEYRYDAHGRTAWVKDPAGIWTRTDFDAKGQVTVVTVDPTSVPDANGTLIANATGLNLTTAYTYDARGKTLTVTEGAGTASARTTEYRYDTLGRRTQQIQDPAGLNLVTAYTYDANDNVVAKTDANGHVTRYTYDADNRLTYTVAADGAVTKHDYDAHGNLSGITAYATRISLVGLATPASSADIAARITSHANDRLTRQVFDRDNRRTHSIDAAGYVTATTYDANGNVLTSTRYAQAATGFNADGTPQVAADAKDQVTQYTYDAANRVTDVTDAMGSVTHHVYDAAGHVTDTTRATGTAATSTTHYQYDAAGRVTDETRAYGTADASTTHYQYDALGHQTAITEAYGTAAARTTRQEFDAAGRKTAAIQVMGAGVEYRTTTEYNAAGDIVKVTDANGNAGYFYTDALGRVTLQVNPDGAAIAHTYDALGNETQTLRYATKVTGPLTTTSAPSVTTASGDQKQTASYDALGRRITIQTWWGSNAADYYTETFTYDAFGNVLTSTARNGAVTTTLYDKLNRKTSETLPIQSRNASGTLVAVVNTYAYDMAGNLTTKTEAAGLPEQRVTTYEYDRLDRQTQELGQAFLAYNPTTQTEASVTPTRSKTYDARGNVTSETDANGNQTFHYYDAQDRTVGAISADGTYTTWIYDAAGNKTSQTVYATPIANPATGTVPTPTPDSANDRTVLYSYDQLGRVTGTEIRNITTGTYNTTTGQYPVTTGSITTTTVYDALGNVIKTIDANGNVGRTYYNGAGQATAQLDAAGYLTTWTRDAYGNVSRETKYATKLTLSVTDGTTYAQLIASVTTSAQDRITDTTYDQINRITTESRLNVAAGTLDANGNLTTATSAATIRYAYDGLNNITQKTDATNQVTDWVYDGLGRQTRQLNPTMTDQNGTSVRPQMDTEYDGLSNVTRKLQRGTDNTAAATLSGQVESDDRIITYQYTAGKLTAETDAAGARIEYRYDANGNVTKKTLKNRVNADGSATDDVTLFFYDAQNRQAKTQDISTGLISEVRYDSFNQITGKRSYTGTAPTTWQEFAEYDRAGRLWKGNSGDGVTKVYVRDGNGNATLTISGTLEMANLSLAQVLNQKAIDAQNGTPQQTLYTSSVFDQRNQLVDTVKPPMDAAHQVVVMQTSITGQGMFVPTMTAGQIGSGYQTSGITPTEGGTISIGGGSVSWSGTYSAGQAAMYGMPAVNASGSISVVVPNTLGLGTGTTKVEVTATVYYPATSTQYSSTPARNVTTTQTVLLTGSQTTANVKFDMGAPGGYTSITSLTIRATKNTSQGDVVVANRAWTGTLLGGGTANYNPAYNIGTPPVTSSSGSVAMPKRVVLGSQPSGTSKVIVAYRVAGSTVPFTAGLATGMVNAAGAPMAGMYAFDTTALGGNNYEYQYLALDANGTILNQQSGTFNTSTLAQPVQTPILIGGIGRTLITNGSSAGSVLNGLQLVDQGSNVGSVSLRYRVKNSGSSWTTIPASSFVKNTGTTGLGTGNFTLPTSALSVFANNTAYEIDFNVFDTNGALLRTVSTELTSDASGNKNVGVLMRAVDDSIQAGTPPTVNGTLGIGGGSVSWSGTYSAGQAAMYGMPAVNASGSISVVVPNTLGLGTGTTKVEVTATVYYPATSTQYSSTPARNVTTTQTVLLTGSQTTANVKFDMGAPGGYTSITSLTIRATKNTSQGDVVVANRAWTGTLLGGGTANYNPAYNIGTPPVTSSSGSVAMPKRVVLGSQPSGTSKVIVAYRVAGSTVPFTAGLATGMVNAAGAPMAGMYAFDTTALGGNNYEYQYLALDANGTILNQQSGTFNTSTLAQPVQTPILIGGIGRTLITNGSSAGSVLNGLQLVDQGSNVGSVSLRYRVKNSGSSWTTIPASSFVKNTGTTGLGTGNFTLPTSALSVFANNTAYEIDFNVFDTNGALLRTVSTELTSDASGNKNVGKLYAYDMPFIKVTFTQPSNAQTIEIRYKIAGSASYSTPFRIPVTATGSGQFVWNTNVLAANVVDISHYDFDITAYDSVGLAVNHNQIDVTVDPNLGNPVIVNNITIKDLPQVLRITPPQSGVSYIDLGYRPKGSNVNDDYTTLAVVPYNNNGTMEYRAELLKTVPYDNNGTIEYRLEPLDPGLYEYHYTAYGPDTTETDYDLIVTPDDPNTPADETVYGTKTIQHALGSADGDFTVGGTTSSSATRIDYLVTSEDRTSVIHRRQEYNAFGEVVEEIDGNGNKVQFEYNTLGQLTIKRDPETDITLANGFVTRGTPETGYTYDLAGRLIAVKDANGNVNTQAWLAGADGNQIVLEKHADGGIVTRKFDVFGDLRSQTDEANRTTQYQYDNMGRLTQITRPSSALDSYTYDAAGNRISHTNALNATEKMDYDSLGRIVRTRSFMGFATQYSYVYSDAIIGLGGLTVGGWQKTTTEATGRTLIDQTDAFGHLTWHKDQGGHEFTYHYNQAGWLMSQTGTSGQNIEYDHYANGYIKSIWDKATGTYTRYEYDADGNRTFEGYITLKNPLDLMSGAKDYYQYAEIEYDELNRIKTITDPKAIISYEYDANSNRRRVKSVYHDGLNGAQRIQEYWYSYDQMNRFLVTMGKLTSGTRGTTAELAPNTSYITANGTADGVAISYNFAGERTEAVNSNYNTNGTYSNDTESYTYSADGYLTEVRINGVIRAIRTNDALGRVTMYREYKGSGSTLAESYRRTTNYDADNRTVKEVETYPVPDANYSTTNTTFYYYYNDIGDNDNLASQSGTGALQRTYTETRSTQEDSGVTKLNTYYDYQYWDEAKQKAITTDAVNTQLKKNNKYWKDGYSDLYYDVNGHLTGAKDRVGNRSIRYVTDAQGQILLRDEFASEVPKASVLPWGGQPIVNGTYVNRIHRYYYVDGQRVGDVGNDGPTNTDYAQALAARRSALKKQDPIKGNIDKYANFKPIASADFDQNYEPIGPTYPGTAAGSYTVRNGDTLQSIALSVWGDSAMWYLIADANGLNTTQALTAGMSLTIPNKVVNIHNNSGTYRVYNPGEAIGDVSPTLPDAPPPPKDDDCGFKEIIVAIVAVAVVVTLGPEMAVAFGELGGAMVTAGVANVASQAAGNVLGIQDGFSFSSFATDVLTAGLTEGLLGGTKLPNGEISKGLLSDAIGGLSIVQKYAYMGAAINAVASNVIRQGVGNLTGAQQGFSWTSVAAAGVGGAVGHLGGSKLDGINPIVSGAVTGMAGNVATQLTQIALDGNGQLSWSSIAIAGIQGAGSGYNEMKRQDALIAQQRSAQGNTTQIKKYDDLFNSAIDDILAKDLEGRQYAQLSSNNTVDFIEKSDKLGMMEEAKDYILSGAVKEGGWLQEKLDNYPYLATALNTIREEGLPLVDAAWAEVKENAWPIVRDVAGAIVLTALDVADTAVSPGPDTSIWAVGILANRLDKTLGYGGAFINAFDEVRNFDIDGVVKKAMSGSKELLDIKTIIADAKDLNALKAIPGLENSSVRRAFQNVAEKVFSGFNSILEKVSANHPTVKVFTRMLTKIGLYGERIDAALLSHSGLVEADSVRGLQNKSGHGVDLFAKATVGKNANKWIAFEIKTSTTGWAPNLSAAQARGADWYSKDRLTKAVGKGAHWVIGQSIDQETVDYANVILKESKRYTMDGYVIFNNKVRTTTPIVNMVDWDLSVSNKHR